MLAIQYPTPVPEPSKTSLTSLPNELLLEIIPHIYTPHTFSCLCSTCNHLSLLIKTHETTLVQSILRLQPPGTLDIFPGLLPITTFSGLEHLHTRLENLTSLHETWLKITSHGPELHWLKGRWEAIHKAGLLLLHRLQDSGSYNYKVAMLNGFSKTSLACLLFKLVSSIKILRVHGPEPINGRFCAGDVLQRSEIELAFEEMLLEHGPEFFGAMCRAGETEKGGEGEWAVRALEKEIAGMTDRQSPFPNGFPKPPTLTSCLRRAFAAKLGCHISQNVSKMWEILSSTSFDEVNEEKLVKIVRGEEIEGGMKRIF